MFFNGSVMGDFPSRIVAAALREDSLAGYQPRAASHYRDRLRARAQETITNTFAIDRYYKVGYAQTFNFDLQHALPHHLIAEIGYLGTKGTGLDVQRLPNRAAPGSPLTAEERRQIGNAVGFTYDTSQGHSIFHAAQVRMTRRFVKGVSANLLYQFAKSIDNVSNFGGGGVTVAQNDRDLHAERGVSSFDQRHSLTANYVLTSPVGEFGVMRNSKVKAAFLRNWTLSGNFTAAAGTPLTARVLGNLANSGGTGAIGSGRADASGEPINGGNYPFFNLHAYMIPPSGRYGNAGRNTVPGPNRFFTNASFGRTFKLSSDNKKNTDLRIDAANLLNNVSFTNVYTVINSTNYGLPAGTLPMRSVNMTFRYRF